MNGEMVKWEFKGREVRTTEKDSQTWWIAKDVCDILGIKQAVRAVQKLDEDEKGVSTIHTLKGEQQLLTVNEFGLYSLILKSRKPEAIAFKRWITHEVIPSIRRNGAYVSPTITAEAAKVLVETIREQEHKLATLENDNRRFRHALYACAPDSRQFGQPGRNGLPRVHPRRSYYQGMKNRFYLTADEVQAVQLLLPLFQPTIDFQPQHELGY